MKKPLLFDKNGVVFIMGPTASGKTAAAVHLAQNFDIQVINADAAQVYKYMDVGTAKPSTQELIAAPHRLLDFTDPGLAYSAANFRHDALNEIEKAHKNHKTPVLVGGSMFYFKALEYGLSELPASDETIRSNIDALAIKVGWQEMHKKLEIIDPVIAEKIHQNDPQRIQRALEIFKITGLPPTEYFLKQSVQGMPYPATKIVVMPDSRANLHRRIEKRFMQMLGNGLIEEVEDLRKRDDLSLELPSMRCVGYRQVWHYLDGVTTKPQMIENAVAATRQLAKRQLTWLRNQSGLVWFVGYNGVDKQSLHNYFAN